MTKKERFQALLNQPGPVLLDGGMGTMLHKSGLAAGELPERLNLSQPQLLTDIHRAYMAAGSRIVYANTFGCNQGKMRRYGLIAAELVEAGVRAAKEAVRGTEALVALDIGPLGAMLAPLGDMPFEEACGLYAEVVRAGRDADVAVIETMSDLYETKAALLAVKENSDLPVMVSMTFTETGRTFTGCTLAAMARTLTALGADAIGLNCSLGPNQMAGMIAEIARHTHLPIIAKPNAGLPDPLDGHYDLTPEDFAAGMAQCIRAGAKLVGGCCGTTPEYIRRLASVQAESERAPFMADGCVCTPTQTVMIQGVRVIGERINPTGKKRFQQALLEKDLDYIVALAVEQSDAGAQVLDVNVGYPGVDETEMLPLVVQKIQEAVDTPLMLDSSNPVALEKALRLYNGKAVVNSVSGEEDKCRAILPLTKKYGAAVVALTLDESGLPDTADKRFAIAEKIISRAEAAGIPREDVWVDCLTLTVSAQQEQAEETLRAVQRVRRELGTPTVLGVSNISFGLPNRLVLTQAFLLRALHAGLTLPIVNPNQREIMDAIVAFRVLSGEDERAQRYIGRFAGQASAENSAAMTLFDAIVRGLPGEAAKLARAAIRPGKEMALVEDCLIPALDEVGARYERGEAFLPQLLSAAQAAQQVFTAVKDSLALRGEKSAPKGKILLATVRGDIHDIGKNIVRTVLENYGYEVTDLGKDVRPEALIQAVQAQNIPLVGLSALMTTTLPAMEEAVGRLKALPNPPRVMVGGAVVTEEYARFIGADAYAKDARQAVEIARQVLGG
ncbi:MAG: homocysteine methyltransferase [Clostridiales bacterium]|nr:homocysteine methyltransferase [Clostridiales bacterium]